MLYLILILLAVLCLVEFLYILALRRRLAEKRAEPSAGPERESMPEKEPEPEPLPGPRQAPVYQPEADPIESALLTEEAERAMREDAANGALVTGKVCGACTLKSGRPGSMPTVYAQVDTGRYKVLVPADKFARPRYERTFAENRAKNVNLGETLEEVTLNYIRRRLDSEVDLLLYDVREGDDGGEPCALGDRMAAMTEMRRRNWYKKVPEGEKPELRKGCKVLARVVTVSPKGIRVEVYGAETFIPIQELDYAFLDSADSMFYPGQKVWCMLTEVSCQGESLFPVAFSASVKAARPDPRAAVIKQLEEGNIYTGSVNFLLTPSAERPNVKPTLFAKLDAYNIQVACPIPHTRIVPEVGLRCQVTITNFDYRGNRVYGVARLLAKPQPIPEPVEEPAPAGATPAEPEPEEPVEVPENTPEPAEAGQED